MKSIKMKIISLVLGFVFLCSFAIGTASIVNAKKVVDADSALIMNLLCSKRTNELNAILQSIEQSVNNLTFYAVSQLSDLEAFKNSDTIVNSYSNKMTQIAITSAQNTPGAMAVYIRFSPEFTDPESGIFWVKDSRTNAYAKQTPTNITLHDASDTDYVGWFYEPLKNQKGTWLAPYLNKNIDAEMISYVVPFYINNEFVGVVGMDIRFSLLENIVSSTSVYDTGYAFLTDNKANIVSHYELPQGTNLEIYNNGEFKDMALEAIDGDTSEQLFPYSYDGIEKKACIKKLVNDMRFVLTAPISEIDKQANNLTLQILLTVLVIVSIAIILTIVFARRLSKPLIELNAAAKKIASGDLSVSITHHSNDEVGTLAESFRSTVANLHKYISYINELAYRDPLTGIKNKTAYLEAVNLLDESIRLKKPQFAVIVFDINGLKIINDTRGHDFGDILISNASKLICQSFKHSPVYRIGGDEFVAILEGKDFDNYSNLLEVFEADVNEYNANPKNEIKVSVARGIALFGEDIDLTYNDVFKRADNAMYYNKTEMKSRQQAENK